MRGMLVTALAGLMLAGCVSEQIVREGRIPPQPRHYERHDRDYARNGDEECRKSANTDDHLDCLRKESARDTWLDPRPLPPQPTKQRPNNPVNGGG